MDSLNALGPLAPVLLLLGSILLLGTFLRGRKRSSGPLAPVAKPFMTRREQAMLSILEQILPMYRIHAQVAMGALLRVPSVPRRSPTPADWNPFARKIVDFVVEDPTTGKVIALIEVDDGSHRIDKDRERDAMTAKAGYRTIRIPAFARPSIPSILRVIGRLRDEAANTALDG